MRNKIMGVIGAALVAVTLILTGPVDPASARPVSPGKSAIKKSSYRPIPRPVVQSGFVWVTAQDGLGTFAGTYATGFWESRTPVTDFTGVKTADGLGWSNTSCPTAVNGFRPPCLRVVWGNLAQDVFGKYEAVFCSGGCVKQGVVTVNRWGPYFCKYDPSCPYEPTWGYENTWNAGTIVTHYFGWFIGLTEHSTHDCASVMSMSAWTCAPPRPGEDWLTDTEAAAVAVW